MHSDKTNRSSPSITIRQLREGEDLSDLIGLSGAFFAEYEHHHEQFFEIDELYDADVEQYFRRSLNTDNAATFVAVLAEKMVGYITVFIHEQPRFYKVRHQVGAISGLMVAREHRRKGIAGKLLARANVFFRERKIAYVTAFTSVNNVAALRFYERHGMEPLHTSMLGQLSGDTAETMW